MAYMHKEDRKDHIVLMLMDASEYRAGLQACRSVTYYGAKVSWTATEIARGQDMAKSTKLYKMLDDLVGEGILTVAYHPYKSGGLTNFRKVFQLTDCAYVQSELAL